MKQAILKRVNPVLEREVQERMRSRRAPLMLFFFVGILTAIAWLVFQVSLGSRTGTAVDPTDLSKLGKAMFEWVLTAMLLLVLFLVPGLAAGAIAGERERQTLIPMQLTLLRPRRIVLGKIAASLAFLTFLLIAAAPLLTLSYVIGGVSVGQIFWGLVSVIFVGFVIASISVMCSTLTNRVQVATVLAFFLVLVMLLGIPILYGVVQALTRTTNVTTGQTVDPPREIFAANPMTLVAVVAGGNVGLNRFGGSDIAGPLSGIKQSVLQIGNRNVVAVNGRGFGPVAPAPEPPSLTGFVVLSFVVQALLALLAVIVASRRIRTPAATER